MNAAFLSNNQYYYRSDGFYTFFKDFLYYIHTIIRSVVWGEIDDFKIIVDSGFVESIKIVFSNCDIHEQLLEINTNFIGNLYSEKYNRSIKNSGIANNCCTSIVKDLIEIFNGDI
jgi:hypothetical protein